MISLKVKVENKWSKVRYKAMLFQRNKQEIVNIINHLII